MNKRLKSFTIMELVVTMVLTGIVVSIGYMGLQLVSTQFNLQRTSTLALTAYMNLSHAVEEDFKNSKTIVLQPEGIVFERGNGTVRYEFADSSIVRTFETAADTFPFFCAGRRLWFENKLQDSVGGLIDAVSFHLVHGKDTLFLTKKKTYDARTLVNTY